MGRALNPWYFEDHYHSSSSIFRKGWSLSQLFYFSCVDACFYQREMHLSGIALVVGNVAQGGAAIAAGDCCAVIFCLCPLVTVKELCMTCDYGGGIGTPIILVVLTYYRFFSRANFNRKYLGRDCAGVNTNNSLMWVVSYIISGVLFFFREDGEPPFMFGL